MLNTPVLQDIYDSLLPLVEKAIGNETNQLIGGVEYNELRKEIPQLFAGISKGAERIKTIVQELKDFSRDEAIEKYDYVNIEEVANSAVILLANLIKKSTHHFKSDFEKLPLIKSNYQKLEQVLINLLQNACQSLENTEQSVEINGKYDRDNNQIVITVTDEGRGIAVENINKIYDPFYTTKRDTGGTGLGLSISLQIIKQHQGEINFTSLPDQGTVVTVTLPVNEKLKE
jgi:signal transduction histidine kinase